MTERKNPIAYQKTIELGVEIHRLVKKLPPEEIHVLAEELMRTVCSIALTFSLEENSTIASEIPGKIAVLETLLLICVRLEYFEEPEMQAALALCSELERMSKTL